MKMLFTWVIVLTCLGCSVGDKVTPVPLEPSRTYNASFDKTWTAAIAAITSMNFPIKTIEKSSGLLNTDEVLTSSYVFMTSAHLYASRNFEFSKEERASLQAVIVPSGNETSVNLKVNIRELGQYGWFSGPTKGVLEKNILDKIAENVK